MDNVSNANDILSIEDRPSERVEVPEWNRVIYLRTLSAAERDVYETEIFEYKKREVIFNRLNIKARLLVRCIANEQGNRIFADNQVDALGNKSAKVLNRLFDIAQKLNGLTVEDVEELEKN